MKALRNYHFFDDQGVVQEYDESKFRSLKPQDRVTPPKAMVGCMIESYQELLLKIAELNYSNQDLSLVFRGQSQDFQTNSNNTSSGLYPSIFRNPPSGSNYSAPKIVDFKFKLLNAASNELKESAHLLPLRVQKNIRNIEVLRWALIQHYEIADTPYLDLTPFLGTALNFALQGATDFCYIYVVGLPNQNNIYSGSVVDSIESIYLPRYCPPEFTRPHIQSGFVVGEFPPVTSYVDRREAGETRAPYNFHNRLVGKFKIPVSFDREGLAVLSPEFLLPTDDVFLDVSKNIKQRLEPNVTVLNRVLNGESNDLMFREL